MQAKAKWSITTLIWCLFFNGLLTAVFYSLAAQSLAGIDQWLQPLLNAGAEMGEEARLAVGNLNDLLTPIRTHLALVLFGASGLSTLILWLFIQGSGRALLARTTALQTLPTSPAPAEAGPGRSAAAASAPSAAAGAVPPAPPSSASAVQILGILQRQGRLIDFLQEDLSHYQDDQIGAAVRSIHQDCKTALAEHVKLVPIFAQDEGTRVTLARDFDPAEIRLTGSVSGAPPFQGILRHRGWRVERLDLPQVTSAAGSEVILAPAEVEVEAAE